VRHAGEQLAHRRDLLGLEQRLPLRLELLRPLRHLRLELGNGAGRKLVGDFLVETRLDDQDARTDPTTRRRRRLG